MALSAFMFLRCISQRSAINHRVWAWTVESSSGSEFLSAELVQFLATKALTAHAHTLCVNMYMVSFQQKTF